MKPEVCDSCRREFPAKLPRFIVGAQVHCRNCHYQEHPTCPYCRQTMPRAPKSRFKCDHCGNPVHVRTTQDRFESCFLTRSQVDELEAVDWLWAGHIPSEKFDAAKTNLAARFGCEPSVDDILWAVLNTAAIEESDAVRSAHIEVMKAERIFREGKDPQRLALREAYRNENLAMLMRWREEGIVIGVTIRRAPDRCPACKRLPKRRLTLDEAIELQLLPHPKCENEAEEYGGHGVCRCMYRPLTEYSS